jgi:SAM-dependent methyltransferase
MTSGAGAGHDHLEAPSAWVCRWADRVRAGGRVLDVACGGGRHARFFAARGHPVEAVDRDAAALAGLATIPGITTRCADIEGGPWPYAGETFAGIVVVNYLHRPLFPHLFAALAANGALIYETFAAGNERYGRPANPDFLLQPGELLELARGRLRVIAYEDLFVAEPKPAMVQRICALRGAAGAETKWAQRGHNAMPASERIEYNDRF